MPEFDEFGIPIKKAESKQNEKTVDEFGIPIKKKIPTESSNGSTTVVSNTANGTKMPIHKSALEGIIGSPPEHATADEIASSYIKATTPKKATLPGTVINTNKTDKTSVAPAIEPESLKPADPAQYLTAEFNKKHGTDYTVKQISGKEPIPEPLNALEATGKNILANSDKVFAGAMKMPMNLTRVIANPLLTIAGVDDTAKKDMLDSFEDQDAMARSLKFIGDYYNREGDKLTEEVSPNVNMNPKTFMEAANKYSTKIAGFVPYMLALPAAGEMMSAGVLGSIAREDVQDNPHMTESQKDLNATALGIAGGIAVPFATKMFSSNFAPLVEKLGMDEAKLTVAKSVQKVITDAIKPYHPITKPLIGAATGMGLELANHFANKLTNPDYDDSDLMDRLMDSAKTFGLLQTAGVVTGGAYNGIKTKLLQNKYNDAQSKIQSFDNHLENPEISDVAKESFEAERQKEMSGLNDLVAKEDQKFDNLMPEHRAQVMRLQNEGLTLENDLKQLDPSDPAAKLLQDKITEIDKQQQEIINDNNKTKKEEVAVTEPKPAITNTDSEPKVESGNTDSTIGEATPIEQLKSDLASAKTETKKAEIQAEIDDLEDNPRITGIRNSMVDKERVKRGLPPANEVAKKEFGKTWSEGMKAIEKNPNVANDLIAELKTKARPLTDEENAILLHKQIEVQNEYEKTADAINKAAESADESTIVENRIKLARLSDELLDIYNVGKAAGTENARGLATRAMLAKEDFSLGSMIAKKRAANDGKPLDPKIESEIAELHKKIKETQQAFDDYVAKQNEKKAKKASEEDMGGITVEVAKEIKKRKPLSKEALESKKAALLSEAKEILKNRYKAETPKDIIPLDEGNAERDPSLIPKELIPVLKDLQKVYVEDAISKGEKIVPEEMVADIYKELGGKENDFSHEDLRDAISGYGKTGKLSMEELNVQIRKLNRELRDISALEFIQAGERPLKSGFQRDKLTQEERQRAKDIRQKIREKGLELEKSQRSPDEQMASALDAVKTRLKNRIEDLKKQISDGRRSPKKVGVAYDEEAKLLKEEADKLNATLQEIEGKREISDEQRIQVATAAVEKTIAEYEKRIENLDFSKKEGKKTPETAELKALRERRNDLKKELESLKPESLKDAIKLEQYKKRVEKTIAEYEDKLAKGDFAKKVVKEIPLDAEALKLKAENERAKGKYKQGLELDRLKNRTLSEKSQDAFVKWQRAAKLSGISTLAKLTSAATLRQVFTPVEEGVGAVISKIIPKIAAKAQREGNASLKIEAKALTEGFIKGFDDAWKTITLKGSDLENVYGKQDKLPRDLMDFFGALHGGLKAIPKRNEFTRSFEKRVLSQMKSGIDVNDPLIQTKTAIEAYKDANRAIFMQDNKVANSWTMAMKGLEAPDKITGETKNKWIATMGRTLLPFVKIPLNIVSETGTYSTGAVTGLAKLSKALVNGIENLPPEEADVILRHLKKGSVGASFMALGYFNADQIGGYYHKGGKDDQEFGSIKLFGQEIPKYLLHNPLMEQLQIGATIRHIADSRGGNVPKGVVAAGLGLTEEIPFVGLGKTITTSLESDSKFNAFMGELAKGVTEPVLLQEIAKWTDPAYSNKRVKRNPKTFFETLETGIPGLREKVPLKKKK